jgi:glycosyltransferase involved in cell wall biosynthesis
MTGMDMRKKRTVSVVIPAHNEERFVARCIGSVREAAEFYGGEVEIIVVCNRCTDNTADIARELGARVLLNEDRCIAKVRNAGIFAANGDVVMTIDCDNRMTEGTIREAWRLLRSGKYIGGGAPIRFERYSSALWLNDLMCRAAFGITGLYCGIFWAERSVFNAVGGFVDKRAFEDAETAKKLKRYGKACGKKYTVLRKNHLINSTRKYDDMGDWMYFRLMIENAGAMLKAALGDSREYGKLIDKLFYDYNN